MLLAPGWTLCYNIGGMHLCLVLLDAGEGHPSTFYARRLLDDVDMWHCIDKSLHQTEIAVRNGLSRPQPDHDVLHGSSGYLVELGPLGHLFAQQQWALWLAEL